MRNLWTNGILLRILGIFILVVLLGFSPRAHHVDQSLKRVVRTQSFENPVRTAELLALVADQLPWRIEFWEIAGDLAFQGGNYEAARGYYQTAAAYGILSESGYLHWGQAYKVQGSDYTAIQVWQAAQNIFGTSENMMERTAAIYRQNADYPALISILKTLLSFPDKITDPQLNYELGLLLAVNDPAAAPPYLLQAYEINPELTTARDLSSAIQRALPSENPTYTLMTVGQQLAAFQMWPEAARAFELASQQQPEHAEAWAFWGEAQQHLETPPPDNGLSALQTALQLDPQSMAANSFLAIYWQRQGAHDKVVQYLTTAAKIDPTNPDLQVDLGAAHAILGDLDQAESLYRQALIISPHNPQYFRELIEFYLRYNLDIKEVALPLTRAELLVQPENPEILDTMGQVLIRLGDLNTAERFLEQAITINPGFARGHLHLGILYSLKNEPDQATEHLWLAQNFGEDTSIASQAARLLTEISP